MPALLLYRAFKKVSGKVVSYMSLVAREKPLAAGPRGALEGVAAGIHRNHFLLVAAPVPVILLH